jgi:hypothetical protein
MTLFEPTSAALEAIQQGAAPMTTRDGHPLVDGWEEHRRAELEGFLQATPAERLRWLEQAILFAHRTGALPRNDGEWTCPGDRLEQGGRADDRSSSEDL